MQPIKRCARFDELKATGDLPSPSGVALTLLRLTQSDETTVSDIARILQTDPALSGRILKFANSALTGSGRPVVAVSDAVERLGMRLVRQLALSFSVLSNCRQVACESFDYPGFWSRSLAMAVAAQALSRQTNVMASDEAFTCGLLSQVGRLALASIYPADYARVLEQSRGRSPEELLRLEQQQFATDHNELTAAMFQDWGLPTVYVEAVRSFENPDGGGLPQDSRAHQLSNLFHLASHLSEVCVAAEDERAPLMSKLLTRGERAQIDPKTLMLLCDRTAQEWQEWGQTFNVTTHPVAAFADPALEREPLFISQNGGQGATAPEALRILVVDDDPIMQRLLMKHLTSQGYVVFSASNGYEALRLTLEANPHLLITDQMMPEMDGLTLCRALRQTKRGRQIYVIMLTAWEDDDRLVQAFEAGADDYVVKPFKPKVLEARLRAGQRVTRLQEEVERDKAEIRQYITQLAVANRKLEHAALTDPLTDMPNRRCAMDRLSQEWATATRNGRPMACMMVDIDGFKDVNDSHGHDVGDIVLRETAAILKISVRANDVVCRLGGEEFLVICPDTDGHGALECAERIRSAVETHCIRAAGFDSSVTVSIGIAVHEAEMVHQDELLKAADRAVYAAKRDGRNRVCVANVSPAEKVRAA